MNKIEEKKYNGATLKDYYIAYFDILGYKAFFADNGNDVFKFLQANVAMANDIVRKTSPDAVFSNMQFEVKSFSDNFMILIRKTPTTNEYQAMKALVYLMALFQLRFLEKYSILVRGSITKGKAFLNKSIVFGEGLLRAVELENKALFPRIILDSERIDKEICDDLCENCVCIDEDEQYYVDFFNIIGCGVGFDSEYLVGERDHLETINNNIIKLVKKHGKFNRQVKEPKKIIEAEKTISKYAWLLMKFNQYCETWWPEYKIPYTLTLYYRLMRCEINVEKNNG